ncbi:hypothetical protein I6F35_11970 [Bradyrhizobium sp. BRP22]|uniref:hypothetical protein n=1 Tax=Bradyrhizobium sp. BRP22 TaxID=2793821 RepID=UPI001CD47F0E|nr:hypothetical protein [Bradyrhizobium sp. BRP22]MCA1453930.1 hypothetical protein [Bradyrhizobium sp. BRP22]
MNRIQYLKEQIARAERLASNAFDKLTMERLQAFATECRTELALLNDREKRGAWSPVEKSAVSLIAAQ